MIKCFRRIPLAAARRQMVGSVRDAGTTVGVAAAPQSERKARLIDAANVWTLMGFWALLQARGLQDSTASAGMVCPASLLLEETRSHPGEARLHGLLSFSVDSDAGLASEANRSFCWVLTAFLTVVFILKYTLCRNCWILSAFQTDSAEIKTSSFLF